MKEKKKKEKEKEEEEKRKDNIEATMSKRHLKRYYY